MITTVKLERSKITAETYKWLEYTLGPGRIDVQHAFAISDVKWAAWTSYTLNGIKRTDYGFFEFKNTQDAVAFKMAWG